MPSRGRAVPEPALSRRELEHLERRAALLTLDPTRIRAWAAKWRIPLLPADDEAILRDPGMPPAAALASARWLAERGDELAISVLRKLSPAQGEPD